jgi:hypothetical protein
MINGYSSAIIIIGVVTIISAGLLLYGLVKRRSMRVIESWFRTAFDYLAGLGMVFGILFLLILFFGSTSPSQADNRGAGEMLKVTFTSYPFYAYLIVMFIVGICMKISDFFS